MAVLSLQKIKRQLKKNFCQDSMMRTHCEFKRNRPRFISTVSRYSKNEGTASKEMSISPNKKVMVSYFNRESGRQIVGFSGSAVFLYLNFFRQGKLKFPRSLRVICIGIPYLGSQAKKAGALILSNYRSLSRKLTGNYLKETST